MSTGYCNHVTPGGLCGLLPGHKGHHAWPQPNPPPHPDRTLLAQMAAALAATATTAAEAAQLAVDVLAELDALLEKRMP